jgi:undecaprenyl-diphosphatase
MHSQHLDDAIMELWEIILLGIVQGIAEFLPISSSGHLTIIESLMGHSSENLALNIALHVGTLLSILVIFRKELIPTLKQPKLVLAVILATIPIVVSAMLFGDFFAAASNSSMAAGVGLLITAVLMFWSPFIDRGTIELKDISLKQAFIVGLFQAIAPFPGISRSGSTIAAGMLAGLRRDAAAKFSFYIAVPAIAGAVVKEVLLEDAPITVSLTYLLIGAGAAFLVGILCLNILLKIVSAGRLKYFGWYVLVVGILTIAGSQLGWFGSPEFFPSSEVTTHEVTPHEAAHEAGPLDVTTQAPATLE